VHIAGRSGAEERLLQMPAHRVEAALEARQRRVEREQREERLRRRLQRRTRPVVPSTSPPRAPVPSVSQWGRRRAASHARRFAMLRSMVGPGLLPHSLPPVLYTGRPSDLTAPVEGAAVHAAERAMATVAAAQFDRRAAAKYATAAVRTAEAVGTGLAAAPRAMVDFPRDFEVFHGLPRPDGTGCATIELDRLREARKADVASRRALRWRRRAEQRLASQRLPPSLPPTLATATATSITPDF
jgi:hypothetical protein